MSRKFLTPLVLPADPTAALEAVTKQYVDARAGSEVEIAAADPIGTNPTTELWYDTATAAAALLASQVAFTPVGSVAATNVQSAIAEVASEAARGIVAWKMGTAAPASLTTTPVTIYTVAAPLVAGRMYEIFFNCRAVQSTQYVNFAGTVAPTTGAPFLCDVYSYAPTTYGFVEWHGLCVCTVTGTYTFTITAKTASSTGGVWTDSGGGIRITDVGPTIASS
jgi:hypothetical protein